MSKFSKISLSSLASFAGLSFAYPCTQTLQYTASASISVNGIGTYSQTLFLPSVPRFNPAFGTLTGVSVRAGAGGSLRLIGTYFGPTQSRTISYSQADTVNVNATLFSISGGESRTVTVSNGSSYNLGFSTGGSQTQTPTPLAGWQGVGLLPIGWQSNVSFSGLTGFSFPSITGTLTSTVTVTYTYTPNPQLITGSILLGDVVPTFAFPRPMTGVIRQGTTNVGSATVNAAIPSSSFTISVAACVTGPAVLEWDGSSFLRRRVTLNLTGASQALGTISLRNGDIDNSGEVDSADIDAVISAFGQVGNIVADADASGEVDAGDVDIVIANFGGVND